MQDRQMMEEVHAQADLVRHAEGQRPRRRPGQRLQQISHRTLGHKLHHQPRLQPRAAHTALEQTQDPDHVRIPSLEHQVSFSLDGGR